jgi:hypothetical protein
MKDVLQAIRELPNVRLGLLRISCSSKAIQGKILFSQSRHILGASCSGEELAEETYEGLKALLQVKEGNFAFLDISDDLSEIEQSLFIDINRVLECWPQLPQHSCELFDQSGLLDKVFGQSCQTEAQQPQAIQPALALNIAPRNQKTRKTETAPLSKPVVAPPITQWNVVEALFENPQAAHTDHAECPVKGGSVGGSMIPNFVQTADEQRSSMNRLRALPESSVQPPQWQRLIKETPPVKWILAALGLSLLVFMLAQQIPDDTAAATNQRVAVSSSTSAH